MWRKRAPTNETASQITSNTDMDNCISSIYLTCNVFGLCEKTEALRINPTWTLHENIQSLPQKLVNRTLDFLLPITKLPCRPKTFISSWIFKNASSSKAAPHISSAAMLGCNRSGQRHDRAKKSVFNQRLFFISGESTDWSHVAT